jgi:hypothetical protein
MCLETVTMDFVAAEARRLHVRSAKLEPPQVGGYGSRGSKRGFFGDFSTMIVMVSSPTILDFEPFWVFTTNG